MEVSIREFISSSDLYYLSVGNLTVLWIWGRECEVFMQLIHFAYGFGGILGSLITR